MLISTLRWLWDWLLGRRAKPTRTYSTVFVEELPEHLEKLTIYVIGEGEHLWSVAMVCPCSCGEVLHMSLHREGRPRWELIQHPDGTISLSPSVWRKIGCRSHFYLKQSQIDWCSNVAPGDSGSSKGKRRGNPR